MSRRLLCEPTPLPGLMLIRRQPLADARGSFERLFCVDELAAFGHPGVVAQANRSCTLHVGAVRGMHFQTPPYGDWKVITCTRGSVHDVIVDLRHGSPTLLRWHAVTLAEDLPLSLLVPPGCAHGFQVMGGPAEMIYLHSHPYVPEADAGVRADDPRLAITWPLPIGERSPRDEAHPLLDATYPGLMP